MAYSRDVPWHPHYLISTLVLLVGDHIAKSRLSEMKITESQFAGDVALYTTSRDSFESVAAEFVKVASEWG